jgi:hypothetical protein
LHNRKLKVGSTFSMPFTDRQRNDDVRQGR